MKEEIQSLFIKMFEVGGLSLSLFRRDVGVKPIVHLDFDVIFSYPALLNTFVSLMHVFIAQKEEVFSWIYVPTFSIHVRSLATLLAVKANKKLLLSSAEEKDEKIIILDEMLITGSSLLQARKEVNDLECFNVKSAFVLLNRAEESEIIKLEKDNINVHSFMSQQEVLDLLMKEKKINQLISERIQRNVNIEFLPIKLFEIGALQFLRDEVTGNFSLSFNYEQIALDPSLMEMLSSLMAELIFDEEEKFDHICYAFSSSVWLLGALISVQLQKSMIIADNVGYNEDKLINGRFKAGEKVIILEDDALVFSVHEVKNILHKSQLEVETAFVLLDKEQGEKEHFKKLEIDMIPLFTATQVLRILKWAGKINRSTFFDVKRHNEKQTEETMKYLKRYDQ